MKKLRHRLLLFLLFGNLVLIACTEDQNSKNNKNNGYRFWDDSSFTSFTLQSYPQRAGDPDKGYEYLLYGDYVGSGVPLEVWNTFFPEPDPYNWLQREGESAALPYYMNLFETPNNVQVVGGINCFSCHSGEVDGQAIIGLGNSFADHTYASFNGLISAFIKNKYGEESAEWEAYRRLSASSDASAEYTTTPFKGVSPAMGYELAAATIRDPLTFEQLSEPQYKIPSLKIASDIPPWWNLAKKNSVYYNALGQGDISRLIMQICVMGVFDTKHAESIDANFPDVLAYLKTVEPPPYPREIDESLASQGEEIFLAQCASCHGTYGEVETYPNLLISLNEVGTDPSTARIYYDEPDFFQWLRESWFSQGDFGAKYFSYPGYVAPPLDGIWATAPYLHNGSVPNLEALLNSPTRPTYWRRNFSSSEYDFSKIGWPYTEEQSGGDVDIYDTTIPVFGNQGHTYGDSLSDIERTSLIEYLKGL